MVLNVLFKIKDNEIEILVEQNLKVDLKSLNYCPFT